VEEEAMALLAVTVVVVAVVVVSAEKNMEGHRKAATVAQH
jgi:hypothetical protein